MIIISYYTKNTPYEEVMNTRLLPSVKKWNLNYDIEAIEDLGSWKANTHVKAEFIKKMLIKHKQAIVFLDADATIEKHPDLFYYIEKNGYDIAYHELDWFKMWRKQEGNSKREVLSGTLFLNYTKMNLNFLDAWIDYNKNHSQWEQLNMAQILTQYKDKLKTYPLPYSYITIIFKNKVLPLHMIKKEDIVILHHQASRQYRNWHYKRKNK